MTGRRSFTSRVILTITVASLIFLSNAVADEAQDRLLFEAAKIGNVEQVKAALAKGANPNYLLPSPPFEKGQSPLYHAVRLRSFECTRALLEAGADPLNAMPEREYFSPMAATAQLELLNDLPDRESFHRARASAQVGSRMNEMIDLLLSHLQALPKEDDTITDWLIRPAAGRGDIALLRRAEKLGANIAAVSKNGNTLFISPAAEGRFDHAERWLAEYKDAYRKATNRVSLEETMEHIVRFPNQEPQFAKLLRQAQEIGLQFVETDRWKMPMWKRAVAARLPQCAKILGAPPEEVARITPLTHEEQIVAAALVPTAYGTFTNLTEEFLKGVNDRKSAASALLLSIVSSRKGMRVPQPTLEYLLSLQADLNFEGSTSRGVMMTPVIAAAANADTNSVRWLVEHGADINAISTDYRYTALAFAVSHGDLDVIRWMLGRGAKLQEADTGRSLLLAALNNRNADELLPFLMQIGADPYLNHDKKEAPVDNLVQRPDIEKLRLLDVKGVYARFLAEYTPPKDSPFVGIWQNVGGAYEGQTFTLNHEGLAWIGEMGGGVFPWRTTADNKAIVDATIEGKEYKFEFQLLDPEVLRLRMEPAEVQSLQLYKKLPGKPPSASEFRKSLQR